MQAQEISDTLDRILQLVRDNTAADGSFPSDDPQIMIALELAEAVIQKAVGK